MDPADSDRRRPALLRTMSEPLPKARPRNGTKKPIPLPQIMNQDHDEPHPEASPGGDVLTRIQELTKATLMFLDCIIGQETSPFPPTVEDQGVASSQNPLDVSYLDTSQESQLDWDTARSRLDRMWVRLAKCWKGTKNAVPQKPLGTGFGETVRRVADSIQSFASHLVNLVDTSSSELDKTMREVTEKLKSELEHVAAPSPHHDMDSSAESSRSEVKSLGHCLGKLEELIKSVEDSAKPLQPAPEHQGGGRQQSNVDGQVASKSGGTPSKVKRKDWVDVLKHNASPRKRRAMSSGGRPRGLSMTAPRSELDHKPAFVDTRLPSELWAELQAAVSQLGRIWDPASRPQLDFDPSGTDDASRVVVCMSTKAGVPSSQPSHDVHQREDQEVGRPASGEANAEPLSAQLEKMSLNPTDITIPLEVVTILINAVPNLLEATSASVLPPCLIRCLHWNQAIRSVLDNLGQWMVIVEDSNKFLVTALLALWQESLINHLIISIRDICEHAPDITQESSVMALGHVIYVIFRSTALLLQVQVSEVLAPGWKKLSPALDETFRKGARAYRSWANQSAGQEELTSLKMEHGAIHNVIPLSPIHLLLYLTSKEEHLEQSPSVWIPPDKAFLRIKSTELFARQDPKQ